ncbi:hypothetical protein AOLI_G00325050 [Acnodon oligacanthus]
MFNESDPEHFGSIFRTIFTLFQILSLDDWSLIYMTNSVNVLEISQSEIEEELYKEALRHASSESKHSKRKIELITRRLQLLAAMEQHMQKYRAQACLLDNLVDTFFTLGVRVSSNLETKCSHAVHPPSKENEHDMGRRDECCTLQGKMVQTAAISHLRKEELKFTSSSYTIITKLESTAVNEEVDMVGISSSAPSTGTLTPAMEEVPLPPSVWSRDDESIVCCFP